MREQGCYQEKTSLKVQSYPIQGNFGGCNRLHWTEANSVNKFCSVRKATKWDCPPQTVYYCNYKAQFYCFQRYKHDGDHYEYYEPFSFAISRQSYFQISTAETAHVLFHAWPHIFCTPLHFCFWRSFGFSSTSKKQNSIFEWVQSPL